ncbi:MAG: YggS family pyridoxal phosphate-dependent enzyme [Ruminococcaceae bacterium]|nr:YggS family pyridoxal phosphate-dependent enzyme [Oscillospiraceae bacterium]
MTERLSDNRYVSDNLSRIREEMQEACLAAGRPVDAVKLLAVTKTVEPERINEAIRLGVAQIGENRVQEFLKKKDDLHLDGVQKHLIGHLQTNKVRQIVGQVDMIQSVDSLRLAAAIAKRSEELSITTPVLVEVNIGGEEAKSGISPEELEALLSEIAPLKGIHVCGLMTIPPIFEKECEKRKIFSKMYQLFVDIGAKKLDNIDMMELSMGMSDDYREAILEGSTMVRIGSALFGKRNY